jgi:hypothetical protein
LLLLLRLVLLLLNENTGRLTPSLRQMCQKHSTIELPPVLACSRTFMVSKG